jgi:hypothetical protein
MFTNNTRWSDIWTGIKVIICSFYNLWQISDSIFRPNNKTIAHKLSPTASSVAMPSSLSSSMNKRIPQPTANTRYSIMCYKVVILPGFMLKHRNMNVVHRILNDKHRYKCQLHQNRQSMIILHRQVSLLINVHIHVTMHDESIYVRYENLDILYKWVIQEDGSYIRI